MVTAEKFQQQIEAAAALAGQRAQFDLLLIEHAVDLVTDSNWAAEGIRTPQHWLQVYFALSPAQAMGVIKIANRHVAMGPALELMGQGRLSLDQAIVIATHTPDAYMESVTRMAEFTTVTQLRRTLSKYVFDDQQDIPEVDKLRPRSGELNSYRLTYGDKYVLHVETNLFDGELIDTAIREAKDALYTDGHTSATLYDGLLEVCNRSLSGIESEARQSRYRILVHLDTDGHGWLDKKGALPPYLMEQLTCDGHVVPVWETDAVPVSVGRTQRIVPQRTRNLVEERDKGCRFPACPVTVHTQVHHVDHWAHGGQTDYTRLISLCTHHHAAHHRGEFHIETSTETGQFVFISPGGWPIEPPDRTDPPPLPNYPPGAWQLAHRGGGIDPTSVYFTPQLE